MFASWQIESLKALLTTLWRSLPAMTNVVASMLLLLFVFSILAMNLFGDLDAASTMGLSAHLNYETFFKSLITLTTTFTGSTIFDQIAATSRWTFGF